MGIFGGGKKKKIKQLENRVKMEIGEKRNTKKFEPFRFGFFMEWSIGDSNP